MLDLITGALYYFTIYLSTLIAPIFAVVYGVFLSIKNRRERNRVTSIDRKPRSSVARNLFVGDLVGVGWMFLCVCAWAVLGGVIWDEEPIHDLIHDTSVNVYQFGESVWHELSLMAVTCIYAWWWIRLKRENVKSAFVLAIGGFAIARAILSLYRSLETVGFDVASIDSKGEFIFTVAVVFVTLGVLIIELKRRLIAVNFIVFILALLLVVPQISKTHLLDAIYIMIIPSVAIANWVATSRQSLPGSSNRSKMLAGLVLIGSVAVAVLISGIIPFVIIAPNRATGLDVDETVILHLTAWTSPFVGSALVYFVIKRISIDPINMEWASLAWLILNFMAAFWVTRINIQAGGLVYLGDVLFDFWLVISIGIGASGAAVILVSLLLGRGATVRPLFAASIWLAVLYAMTPLLAHPETPQILRVLYSLELALTLAMVFFITSRVFGAGSPKSGWSAVRRDTVDRQNGRAHDRAVRV